MLPTAVYAAPDFSTLIAAVTFMEGVHQLSGRRLYPPDFHAAVKAGYFKPVQIAGQKFYHKADMEAFAVKWGQRVVKTAKAQQAELARQAGA